MKVAHQGRTDPMGTTVIKPVPYFSSTFRVAAFYECTPRPSSTSGRTGDLIATTRGNNVVKFTPRETVCYDFLWMNVELEEMNCWVRDIFNFSLSSTFFSFIYFLFVDFFVCPFFRFIFFYLLIFFFSLFRLTYVFQVFFFRKPERGLESFNSFFGTNRKLVEQWKMVKIFSMKKWIVELTYIRESTLFVFTMYNSVHSPSFFLCNSHECI